MDRSRDALKEAVQQLVSLHGGQRRLAKTLGVDQSTVSRFLTSGEMTPKVARRLVVVFPGLKPQVDAVFFAPDMQPAHSVGALVEVA